MAKMAIMGEKGLKMVIFHISTTNSPMKMFDPSFLPGDPVSYMSSK